MPPRLHRRYIATMDRGAVAASLLVLVSCASEPPPPCTFKLSHSSVLFEEEYPSYEALLDEPARTVTFEEDGVMVEVTIGAGFCKPYASTCAHPLILEHLRVSSRAPEQIIGYECIGVDGSIAGGIDVFRTGKCR